MALLVRNALLKKLLVALGLASVLAVTSAAQSAELGKRVSEVLEQLRAQDLVFIYNTQLVSDSLRVLEEPQAANGVELAREILKAHGLALANVAPNTYAIVRQPTTTVIRRATDSVLTTPLAEVVVQTSRYTLSDSAGSHSLFTQSDVKALPRLGDETLRAVQRLPGAASNGFSSLGSLRGGAPNETGIVLDGMRLYEPFHLKDFLSPVSLLDSRLIDSLDVYSGGFAAKYGDRMSAIIDARSVHPTANRYYELGINLFHLHGLASGAFADDRAHAFISARRSNLSELVQFAETDFGKPAYSDGFVRTEFSFNDTTRASVSALLSRDHIVARKDQGKQNARADYTNNYVWGVVAHDWSDESTSRLLLGYTDVTNSRHGQVDHPGQVTGTVADLREFHIANVQLSGEFHLSVGEIPTLHRYGIDLRALSADYEYLSDVSFSAGYPFPGSPARQTRRDVMPNPSGDEASVYWDSKFELNRRWAAQLGLRFDNQSEYGNHHAFQWSPRTAILYTPSNATQVRASWGRFYQSQAINELQVEDAVDRFYPAQHTEHTIFSIEHALQPGYRLRLELYRKQYSQLQPRYENLFNPLVLLPEVEFDRVMVAPSSARADGVELLFTARPNESWNAWLGYTWSRAEDRIDGRNVPRSWDQTHAINFGVVWSRGPWSATLADIYHTGWPTTQLQLTAPYAIGQRNATRLSAYNSLDLRVARAFQLSRGVLDVYVEVANATNRRNECCAEYKAEQDGNGATVINRKVDDWLAIVPSAGVLWRY